MSLGFLKALLGLPLDMCEVLTKDLTAPHPQLNLYLETTFYCPGFECFCLEMSE